MHTFLGIDVGGTKLLIGELDEKGEILQSKRYPTGFKTQTEIVDAIHSYLEDYRENVGFVGTPMAAGVGIVGVVDHEKGEWVSMNHLITNPPIPLAKMISEQLRLPVAIDNDVRSATSAELLLGHGKSTDNFIYFNVGTGLAAGFVCDGKIIRGKNNNAGEIGHTVVDFNSEQLCVCGRYGCAENVISGMGFSRRARELSPLYPDSRLTIPPQGNGLNAVELFALADEGDMLCLELTQTAAKALACVIMNAVRVTDPDMIILGGGLASDGWLLPKVTEQLNQATMRGVSKGVVISNFSPSCTGLIGAASLGMRKILG